MKLAEAGRFALSLPEVTQQPHFDYASFRVRGKIFATVPPDEAHLNVFVAEVEREQALVLYPEFLEKLLWGGKVVGLRVVLGKARSAVVRQLLQQAWRAKAPKALVAQVLQNE